MSNTTRTQTPKRTGPLTGPQRKVLALGFRQAHICSKTGLTPLTVSRALRGISFTEDVQRRIAAAVGTTPLALFGDMTHPKLRLEASGRSS